jgi:hypothetical protein
MGNGAASFSRKAEALIATGSPERLTTRIAPSNSLALLKGNYRSKPFRRPADGLITARGVEAVPNALSESYILVDATKNLAYLRGTKIAL